MALISPSSVTSPTFTSVVPRSMPRNSEPEPLIRASQDGTAQNASPWSTGYSPPTRTARDDRGTGFGALAYPTGCRRGFLTRPDAHRALGRALGETFRVQVEHRHGSRDVRDEGLTDAGS